MQYTRLGRSGLEVSRICLGTAFRANLFKENFDAAACERIVHRALDLGINFIDCANYYSYGRSEALLGDALRGKRDSVVLATKVSAQVNATPGPNDRGLSRFHILREIEHSLTRLRTDHIDIYWLHQPDPHTPIDETLRALDDLIHAGKVRYIGCSNYAAWQLLEGLWRSDALHLNAFVALQDSYSLLARQRLEAELLPACQRYGLGIVAYSPLAVGMLSGRFRRGQPAPAGTPWADEARYRERLARLLTPQADAVIQAVTEIAAARESTPAQIAIAWILANREISSVISGPDHSAQLDEVVGALDIALTAEEMTRLTAISAFEAPTHFA